MVYNIIQNIIIRAITPGGCKPRIIGSIRVCSFVATDALDWSSPEDCGGCSQV